MQRRIEKYCIWIIAVLVVVLGSAKPAAAAPAACSDTQWTIKAYSDLLFRQPSQNELAAWIDPNSRQLALGADRFEAAWAIANSNEGTGYLLGLYAQTVAGYFQKVLGRTPTADEFNLFYGQLGFPQGNAADYALLSLLIGGNLGNFSYANEFETYAVAQNPGLAGCSPSRAVVNQIFRVYMERDGTQQELDQWTALLNTGHPLQEVALGISGTPDLQVGQGTGEYFNLVVREAFQRFYRRQPGPQELVSWSNALAQNGLNVELWGVLMSADEYCQGFTQQLEAKLPAQVPPVVQNLGTTILTPPLQGGFNAPNPLVAADNVQVNSLINQVNAQTLTIARLVNPTAIGGFTDTVGNPGPQQPAPVAQVVVDLTAEIGSLTSQNTAQQSTISAQQQQNAQLQATIDSVVLAQFGMAEDQNAAFAARDLAQTQVQKAVAAAGPNNRRVQDALKQFNRGLSELTENDYAGALIRFRLAFRAANAATQPDSDR